MTYLSHLLSNIIAPEHAMSADQKCSVCAAKLLPEKFIVCEICENRCCEDEFDEAVLFDSTLHEICFHCQHLLDVHDETSVKDD